MSRIKLLLTAVLLTTGTWVQAQISVLSINNFNTTNSEEGWTEGSGGNPPNPGPPTWIAGDRNGGASGHLQNTSTGSGKGGKLQMWNTGSVWTGDYIGAGVGFIDLWVDNRSVGVNLNFRIAFDGPGGWFTSAAEVVNAGSGWTNLSFDLDQSNFTYLAGTGDTASFSDTMTMVSNFEIFSSVGLPTLSPNNGGLHLQGDDIVADMRIDGISAVAIPEPKTYGLAIGMVVIAFAVIKTRRRS